MSLRVQNFSKLELWVIASDDDRLSDKSSNGFQSLLKGLYSKHRLLYALLANLGKKLDKSQTNSIIGFIPKPYKVEREIALALTLSLTLDLILVKPLKYLNSSANPNEFHIHC